MHSSHADASKKTQKYIDHLSISFDFNQSVLQRNAKMQIAWNSIVQSWAKYSIHQKDMLTINAWPNLPEENRFVRSISLISSSIRDVALPHRYR